MDTRQLIKLYPHCIFYNAYQTVKGACEQVRNSKEVMKMGCISIAVEFEFEQPAQEVLEYAQNLGYKLVESAHDDCLVYALELS